MLHILTRRMHLLTFIVLVATTATTAHAGNSLAARQLQSVPTDPAAIVEGFLLARSMGDFSGAASWCAPLLELQDQDAQWFVDTPTATSWLHNLSDKYLVETLHPLHVDGYTVSWSERLTQRGVSSADGSRATFTIEVHAVIRDDRIAYLSGPWPPIATSSSWAEPGRITPNAGPGSAATIPPAAMFLGTAASLSLTALLAARGGPAVYGAVRRRTLRRRPAADQPPCAT